MIVYITKGSGVSGAVRYVMGEGRDEDGELKELEPGHETRVAWLSGQGFGFPIDSRERVELARKIMEWSAQPENQTSRTRKCENDCFHAALSWGPDETPSREEMEQAARDYLKALGMENARAIFVAHADTSTRICISWRAGSTLRPAARFPTRWTRRNRRHGRWLTSAPTKSSGARPASSMKR